MLKVVSMIKSGVIYLLSVILAFIAGFGVAYGMALKVINKTPRRRTVHYRDYCREKDDEES